MRDEKMHSKSQPMDHQGSPCNEIVEISVTDHFGGAPKSLQMVTAAMKLKEACSLEEKLHSASTAY